MGRKKTKNKQVKMDPPQRKNIILNLLLYIVLPIACAAVYEYSKTYYYNKFPLLIQPARFKIDGNNSLSYKIDILNRSTRIVNGVDVTLAILNKDIKERQIEITPTKSQMNSIVPYLQNPGLFYGKRNGYPVFSLMYQSLLPGESSQLIMRICDTGECDPKTIVADVQVEYKPEIITFGSQ